jgi:hypothetical protein
MDANALREHLARLLPALAGTDLEDCLYDPEGRALLLALAGGQAAAFHELLKAVSRYAARPPHERAGAGRREALGRSRRSWPRRRTEPTRRSSSHGKPRVER